MYDQTQLPAGLQNKTLHQLRTLARAGFASLELDNAGWAPPQTKNVDCMLEYIDELCNEFGLMPSANGTLVKRAA